MWGQSMGRLKGSAGPECSRLLLSESSLESVQRLIHFILSLQEYVWGVYWVLDILLMWRLMISKKYMNFSFLDTPLVDLEIILISKKVRDKLQYDFFKKLTLIKK